MFLQSGYLILLLLCLRVLSKALFAIFNKKLRTGYVLFHKSLMKLAEHI